MTIPFKNIPSSIRVPLFYAEVDNSQANTAQEVQRGLIIGPYTAAAVGVTPGVPQIVQSIADVISTCGSSSLIRFMVEAWRANDTFGELWYLPVADNSGAVSATATIAITAAATASGTLYLYIAGVRYSLPVLASQTTAQVAAALTALINSDSPICPVTASVVGSTVTLSADNKGFTGNDIDIRVNYLGTAGGEATPAGLAFTVTGFAGGSTAPPLATALANCGDRGFDFIVSPFNDVTSMDAVKQFLNDQTGRWSYAQQVYGHAFYAVNGTLGTLTTFGAGRNNQHESVMGFKNSPTPPWVWAAATAAAAAVSLRIDPALPLQTVAIAGVLPSPLVDRFVLSDRNTLLYTGIATHTTGDDGTVRIENLITTYQKNAFGAADNSYLEVETLFTLAFVLRFMKIAITSKYSRVKLASNQQRIAAGSAVVTPNMIKAELIAQYRQLESLGMVQNADAFKQGLVVEQNASNPNRVDVLWPGTLIDQLRVFALLAQFRLI